MVKQSDMVIKPDPKKIQASAHGFIQDYVLPTEDVGISYQQYDGRAPDKGYWVNTVCWEAYYVIDGSATIYGDDKAYSVEKGDVFIMLPGQKIRMIAKKLKIITITKPNWFASQAKIVSK